MSNRKVFVLRSQVKRDLLDLRIAIDRILDESYFIDSVDDVFPLLFKLYSYAWRFGCRGFFKTVWKRI